MLKKLQSFKAVQGLRCRSWTIQIREWNGSQCQEPLWLLTVSKAALLRSNLNCRVRVVVGGSRGSNEPPLQGSDGGLKTQDVNFHPKANSGGMENKL